jgi:hypothetical protein
MLSRRNTLLFLVTAFFLMPLPAQQPDLQPMVMTVSGGKIEVTFPDGPMKLSRQELLDWVKSAADAVAHYYGRFPVPHLTLEIRARRGPGVRHGVTYARDGGTIYITVGDQATVADLKNDWMLTHEMLHLAFPSMEDNHHWIEEGISTYVEPVARAQVGGFPVEEVWKQFAHEMPKGQPEDDDEGLDNTHTWGRTYWGGAMFCLLADVEIREQTQNRKGLQDALRAILNHGGDITQDWKIEKAFAIGDKATGTNVLQKLYAKMKGQPAPADLDQLWQKLGVAFADDGSAKFNDKAPEASVRQAITSETPASTRKQH